MAIKILIVEDEILIARELEARLTKLGYEDSYQLYQRSYAR